MVQIADAWLPAAALFTSHLQAFAKQFANMPQGWAANTKPPCQWPGVMCQQPAGTFTVDLSAQSLGGELLPDGLTSSCCGSILCWSAGSLAPSWATLPSFRQGLTSLNLSGNVLQVRACLCAHRRPEVGSEVSCMRRACCLAT